MTDVTRTAARSPAGAPRLTSASAKSPAPTGGPATVKSGVPGPPPVLAPSGTTNGEGKRRAQGWQSAVDSAGAPDRVSSILTRNSDGARSAENLRRRGSVQFSEDTANNTPSPRSGAANGLRGGHRGKDGKAAGGDAAFRQNMSDFLQAMYGDPGAATSSKAEAESGGKGTSILPAARTVSPRARKETGAGGQTGGARNTGTEAPKGPQVKGIATSSLYGGDRIDALVEHLVRAYSRKSSSKVGFNTTPSGGRVEYGETPISYDGNDRKAVRTGVAPLISRGHRSDPNEVSTFVSQAMDSILDPRYLRPQQLTSTKSMLTSLGLDENFEKLLSFRTRSNLNEADVDDEEDTALEPVHVGGQALFKSVGSRPNDVSISKSMPMRGQIPLPPLSEDGRSPSGARSVPTRQSLESLDSGQLRGASPAKRTSPSPAAKGRQGSLGSISLDSKALGMAPGVSRTAVGDDSWGDVDAAAWSDGVKQPPTTNGKLGTSKGSLTSMPPISASPASTSPPVVSSARSLLAFSKDKAFLEKLEELEEQEKLQRNVLTALEQRLRYFIKDNRDDEGLNGGGEKKGLTPSATQRGRRAGTEATNVLSPAKPAGPPSTGTRRSPAK